MKELNQNNTLIMVVGSNGRRGYRVYYWVSVMQAHITVSSDVSNLFSLLLLLL